MIDIKDVVTIKDVCELVNTIANLNIVKFKPVDTVVSELEKNGYEVIEYKKKKIILYEPFDKREVTVYFTVIDDKKYFNGFKIKIYEN